MARWLIAISTIAVAASASAQSSGPSSADTSGPSGATVTSSLAQATSTPTIALGRLAVTTSSVATSSVATEQTRTASVTRVIARITPPANPDVNIAPLRLEVAVVVDPDLPDLSRPMVQQALRDASAMFAERFNTLQPKLRVLDRMTTAEFLAANLDEDDPRCKKLLEVRYRGEPLEEMRRFKPRALRFLRRWKLSALKVFIPESERGAITKHEQIYEAAMRRYAETVTRLASATTPSGAPLIDPARSMDRSFAAWNCALGVQRDYDVIITNAFLLADMLSEPHPHAVFGKAKVGGIAGPNLHRRALGRQALLASTFGIDTDISFLSELDGVPASPRERASIVGAYLLAHEIGHAVFGIPDFFDHPGSCLMTSRPGETYRDSLALMNANPGPCPKCRKWLTARSALDEGRTLLARGKSRAALRRLRVATRRTPRHFHGGYKKRMSAISVEVARAYQRLGRLKRARRFARHARSLDARSPDAYELAVGLGLVETSTTSGR